MKTDHPVRVVFAIAAYVLFWGWNVWFSLWLLLGLGPVVVLEMLVATAVGMIPATIGAAAIALVSIPLFGMVLGLAPRIRRDPGRLLSLFYGVQIPLMVLLAVRAFAIGVLTPATTLALGVGLVGSLGLLRVLWSGPREGGAVRQAVLLAAAAAYAAAGLWVAAVVGLYVASIGAVVLPNLPGLFSHISLFEAGQLLVSGLGLLVFSSVTFGVFPIAMVGIAGRTLQLAWRASRERIGAASAAGILAGTAAAIGLGTIWTSSQPQAAAFAALDAATTDADRREALARSEDIREGLLAAVLAPERTFDADPEGDHLRAMWKGLVGERLAELPPVAYRILFAPFVYRPVQSEQAWNARRGWVPADAIRAGELYGEFFDAPVEIAERDRLMAAARATWSWEDAQAGLLETGQRKVHLDRQDIEVEPHGDLATVRIHDVYRNRTWDQQEVWLSFSLPETAAITGLWLGTTGDRQEASPYVVAPRGAAQEVYRQQHVTRRDPALLEQVGPRQYRLRAFPIGPREGRPDNVWSLRSEGPELHLWMEIEVAVLDDEDSGPIFPLPQATDVRNLFWDRSTERVLDGHPQTIDGWLPDRVPAPGATRLAREVRIGGFRVRAAPAGPIRPRRLSHAAVLVDGTRSMGAHRDEIARSLDRLRGLSDRLTVLCTVEGALARCDGYDAREALFWGSAALEHRLIEASELARGAEALVVLTDEGSYELAAAAEAGGLRDVSLPPLWLVHFGGMPRAYPDWTADRIGRSGGGVARSLDDVLIAMADPAIAGGYRFEIDRLDPEATSARCEGPMCAIAARRLVSWLDAELGSGDTGALDVLHRVAVDNHVVTPYSSMLVLVDDAQREALARAEAAEDRFDREVESGQESTQVLSVPEPATGVLVGAGGLLLLFARRMGAGGKGR